MTRNHERDHEVLQAFVKTSRDLGKKIEISFGHHQIGLSYDEIDTFLAILDALPGPEPAQGDWEECDGKDLRQGDRYKVEGENWTFEAVVVSEKTNLIMRHPHNGAPIQRSDINEIQGLALFRIPAPVVHPDPMEHHIITCHDRENDYFWNGVTGKYMGLYDPRNLYSREDFINWSPAKVVSADE